MKYIIAFMMLSIATSALAERSPAPDVSPVECNGIRYVAPNQNGRIAYLEAWDIQMGKRLWETVVFRNRIKPGLEEDVQWVYIEKVELVRNKLIVTDENGRSYSVDRKTGHVQRYISPWILGIAVIAIILIIVIW